MPKEPSAQKSASAGFAALSSELTPFVEFIRRWWLLAVVMVIVSSTTTLVMVVSRGVEYQVSAALYYKLGPELAPPPTMGKDPLVISRRAEDVNNEIEILTSPELIHQVVADLGEDFFREKPPTTTWGRLKRTVKNSIKTVTDGVEEVLIQLGLRRRLKLLDKVELAITSKLKVDLVRESDVISITMDTPAPEHGVVIFERLLEAYQGRHLQVHHEVDVKDFLTKQTKQLREELAASTARSLKFQQTEDLWSAETQQELLLNDRKTIELQIATTKSQAVYLDSLVSSLADSIAAQPESIELSKSEQINPAVVDLEDRAASLSTDSAVIETSYRSGAREVEDRQTQIAGLRRRILAQPHMVLFTKTTGANVMRQDLSRELSLRAAELSGTHERLTEDESRLASVNKKLQQYGAASAKYQELEREHGLLEKKYALYCENFQKAEIAAVMNLEKISNMKVISPPAATMQPVRPRLSIMAAAGILSGLAFAFILGMVFELRAAARKSFRQN